MIDMYHWFLIIVLTLFLTAFVKAEVSLAFRGLFEYLVPEELYCCWIRGCTYFAVTLSQFIVNFTEESSSFSHLTTKTFALNWELPYILKSTLYIFALVQSLNFWASIILSLGTFHLTKVSSISLVSTVTDLLRIETTYTF